MNDDVATRLKQIRAKRGYPTAKEAAEAMGMKYPTYSEHERFGTDRYVTILRYAKFFRVSPDWLLNGGGEDENLTEEAESSDLSLGRSKQVPLFNLAEVSSFMQIQSNAFPESNKFVLMTVSEDTPANIFATKICDRSMTQTAAPSLPKGTTCYIDPDAEALPGEMVLAVIDGFKAGVIRHYARSLVEGIARVVLTPFNPAFETISFKPDERNFIVGPVVSALLTFRL